MALGGGGARRRKAARRTHAQRDALEREIRVRLGRRAKVTQSILGVVATRGPCSVKIMPRFKLRQDGPRKAHGSVMLAAEMDIGLMHLSQNYAAKSIDGAANVAESFLRECPASRREPKITQRLKSKFVKMRVRRK